MAKSKIIKANEKIAEKAASGYRTIEETVVGTYKKIEDTFVGAYSRVEDAFVDRYLTHDGESTEEAKSRLRAEKANRQDAAAAHGSHRK